MFMELVASIGVIVACCMAELTAFLSAIVNTFGDSEYGVGKLITLWDSNWMLMVSENDGYGRKVLQVDPGDKVIVLTYAK